MFRLTGDTLHQLWETRGRDNTELKSPIRIQFIDGAVLIADAPTVSVWKFDEAGSLLDILPNHVGQDSSWQVIRSNDEQLIDFFIGPRYDGYLVRGLVDGYQEGKLVLYDKQEHSVTERSEGFYSYSMLAYDDQSGRIFVANSSYIIAYDVGEQAIPSSINWREMRSRRGSIKDMEVKNGLLYVLDSGQDGISVEEPTIFVFDSELSLVDSISLGLAPVVTGAFTISGSGDSLALITVNAGAILYTANPVPRRVRQ